MRGIMKLKTMCRAFGICQAGIFSGGLYFLSDLLIKYSGHSKEFLLGDYPIEQKMYIGAYMSGAALIAPLTSLAIVDGLTDVVKGTHHYFGCKVLQKLTRNKEKKEKIQSELEQQLKVTKKDLSEILNS